MLTCDARARPEHLAALALRPPASLAPGALGGGARESGEKDGEAWESVKACESIRGEGGGGGGQGQGQGKTNTAGHSPCW
jgi:hypothetical protein